MDEIKRKNGGNNYLVSDETKCSDCGNCENLLHGFKSIYNGRLLLAKVWIDNEDVKESIDSLKQSCPNKAIDIIFS
jgi:hypothetical protein